MKVLVTGANGFVGRWLVRALRQHGHQVVAAAGPEGSGTGHRAAGSGREEGVEWVPLDLRDIESVRAVLRHGYDAVAHLAGQSSGGASYADPGTSWEINAAGTARLAWEVARVLPESDADPTFLLVSTSDVYDDGAGRLIDEDGEVSPRSPYAASKLGAELAAREILNRTGLKLVIARAFPHTGPGQDPRFVAPVLAQRLRTAKQAGLRTVPVGNLRLTRDFLDVRDVVEAYVGLLEKGEIAEVYNVASGTPVRLEELFRKLAGIIGTDAEPELDPALLRDDAEWLVGDASRLRAVTGWSPRYTLDTTLRDLVDAQAN